MNNDIKWYISSDGELKDIKTMNTEHLINSLAKHHREIYNSLNENQFIKHSEQIALIESELLKRNKQFYDINIGGKQKWVKNQ